MAKVKLTREQKKQSRIERRFPDIAGDIRINALKLINCCIKDPETGCWNAVRGGFHKQGYPMIGAWRISDQKKIMTTGHRAIKKLDLKSDLAGLDVYHECSNFRCVNPDHLTAGQHSDNMQHMWAVGRGAKKRNRKKTGNPHHVQKRYYKYSIEEKLLFRSATPEEVQARFPNLPLQRINKLRWSHKRPDQAWLDEYLPGGSRCDK